MVRPNRIKVNTFSAFTVNGSVLSNTFIDGPNKAINGEIVKIQFENITSPGSFWIAESGTDIEFWRRNNVTSGIATFEVYPFVYVVDNTNSTGSPQAFAGRVTNGPIYVAASGLTSGTDTSFGPVTVYYR